MLVGCAGVSAEEKVDVPEIPETKPKKKNSRGKKPAAKALVEPAVENLPPSGKLSPSLQLGLVCFSTMGCSQIVSSSQCRLLMSFLVRLPTGPFFI